MENRFVSAECIELAVCWVCLVTAFNHFDSPVPSNLSVTLGKSLPC